MVMSFDVLFLLNSLAFLVSAGLVVSVVLLSPQTADDEALSVWRKVSQGMRVYLKTPRLRGMLTLNMAVSAAEAMQNINTVVYVRSVLGLHEQALATRLWPSRDPVAL